VNFILHYNILLVHCYMYSMKAVVSLIFCTMKFHHEGKVITIDPLWDYKLNPPSNLDNIFPIVIYTTSFPTSVDISHGIFKDSSLIGVYKGSPPSIHCLELIFAYTIFSSIISTTTKNPSFSFKIDIFPTPNSCVSL
jgi:hypothetical protein